MCLTETYILYELENIALELYSSRIVRWSKNLYQGISDIYVIG